MKARRDVSDRCAMYTLPFYQSLLDMRVKQNEKMLIFSEEMRRTTDRQRLLVQSRCEQNAALIRQYEQEAVEDEHWKALLEDIFIVYESCGSESLKKTLERLFRRDISTSSADRRASCSDLEQALVSGTCNASVADIRRICHLFDESNFVDTLSLNRLETFANSVEQMRTDLRRYVTAVNSKESISMTAIQELQEKILIILKNNGVSNLEVEEEDIILVDDARNALVVLAERLSDMQLKTNTTSSTTRNIVASKKLLTNVSAFAMKTFPYIAALRRTEAFIVNARSNASRAELPSELEQRLNSVLIGLQYDMLLQRSKTAILDGSVTSMSSSIPMSCIDEALGEIELLLNESSTTGAQVYLRVIINLIDGIIDAVSLVANEDGILMYAIFIASMFRTLSNTMQKQISKIVAAVMITKSDICVPRLINEMRVFEGVSTSAVKGIDKSKTNCFSDTSERIGILYAALVGQSVPVHTAASLSPITAEHGWIWLHRAAHQIWLCTDQHLSIDVNESSAAACRCVRTFLRFAGNALLLNYQSQFLKLLRALQKTVTALPANGTAVTKLRTFLDDALNHQFIAAIHYRGQAPFMLDVMARTRHFERENRACSSAENDRKSPFMQRVKELRINSIPARSFNKLSVTVESQNLVINELLEKAVLASQESQDLLKYTLFKIANSVISYCDDENFKEMDEGNPQKVARVVCRLCARLPEMAILIIGCFNSSCPLTIPKAAERGLSGDAFYQDLRFNLSEGGQGTRVRETVDSWLARMTRILSTYTVLMLAPERKPLSIIDAWVWLVNMVNSCTSQKSLPFYTATALEVFLRISAAALHAEYGECFMQMLRLIRKDILPLLEQDMPKRQPLESFLVKFIDSNGREFIRFFNK